MNLAMASKITDNLASQNIGVQSMMAFAPGVVGVHDSYGHGEFDAYFDKSHWNLRNPALWEGHTDIRNPKMQGIGVIEGLASFPSPRDFHSLFRLAQCHLEPADDSVDWHDGPQNISIAEAGGMAMVSNAADTTSMRGTLQRLSGLVRRLFHL